MSPHEIMFSRCCDDDMLHMLQKALLFTFQDILAAQILTA